MRLVYVAVTSAIFVFIVGCGGDKHVAVKGTLLENGKRVKSKKDLEEFTIQFVPAKADSKLPSGTAEFDPDTSEFALHSATGPGMPPGEYKIVVTCTTTDNKAIDRYKGAFSDEKTPLTYTVTNDSSQEIVIDLRKKSVTKK